MNIDYLTFGELKEIAAMFNGGCNKSLYHDYIGKNVFFRTVTHHYTGKIEKVVGNEMLLSSAAWVADSGRFNVFLKDVSKVNEVEPYKNPIVVNTTAILDLTEIDRLLTKVK